MRRTNPLSDAPYSARVCALVLIACACTLLLATAYASWQWQQTPPVHCGTEPTAAGRPDIEGAQNRWTPCDGQPADHSVPVALAALAVIVTAGGAAMVVGWRSTATRPWWTEPI